MVEEKLNLLKKLAKIKEGKKLFLEEKKLINITNKER